MPTLSKHSISSRNSVFRTADIRFPALKPHPQWREGRGVDHVVVWCICEVVGDKIATVRLVGQLIDPETKRFVQYGKPAK